MVPRLKVAPKMNSPSPAMGLEGTYTEVAAQVGISTSHLSFIMNRKRTPSLPVARKLAKAMGMSLDDLARMLLDRHGLYRRGRIAA